MPEPAHHESMPSRRSNEFLAEVRRRGEPLLTGAGIDPGAVDWTLGWSGPHLRVRYHGPALDPATRQALSVRVLEAVGQFERTIGEVDVRFDMTAA